MPECAYQKLAPALDRFQEAHFWIHMMEEYYHQADPFRWHLNVALKALKETPYLVKHALQNEPGFVAWYKPLADQLGNDPLLRSLGKNRDAIVHQGDLALKSGGAVGITEGRGMKLGFSFPTHPLEDSDAAMDRFLHFVAAEGDFFGFLSEDEDSLPCVQREWRLPDFQEEIVDVCATAWLRIGETIDQVLRWLGTVPPPLSLDCRHSGQQVQFKLYDRSRLNARVEELRAAQNANVSS